MSSSADGCLTGLFLLIFKLPFFLIKICFAIVVFLFGLLLLPLSALKGDSDWMNDVGKEVEKILEWGNDE